MTSPSKPANQIIIALEQAESCHRQGRLQEAMPSYQEVLALDPGNFAALHGIGILFGQLGRFEDALRYIADAAAVQPDNFAVHYNLGKAFQALNRLEEALASYEKALSLKPDYLAAHNNRGNVLKDLRRYDEALASYDALLSLRPDLPESYFNRGNVLKDLLRYDEALASYEMALSLNMKSAEVYNNRGDAQHKLQRYDDALASYGNALAVNPNYAKAYNNLGLTLEVLQRYDEAMASFDKALVFKPDYAEAYNNRGYTLRSLKRYAEALSNYDKAISIRPDYAEAQFNKSRLKLLLGQYAEGWSLYEWRWKVAKNKPYFRQFKQVLWLGDQPVSGKTILLHAEQGFGDVIQFVRYVPMVEALGAKLILGVHPALVPLLHSLNGTFTLATKLDELPSFDLHCPLGSLPLAFKTIIDSIPASVPYLAADSEKRSEWRKRLGDKVRPRIGIAWAGSSWHSDDRNRSVSLRSLEPLLRLNFEYHSLQTEVNAEDRAAMTEFTQILPHESELHDFGDTAALLSEMDLVITVDTAVAHLAGALGVGGFEPDILLQEGDLHVGNVTLQVIHTPGHSPGSICLSWPETNVDNSTN